MNSIVKDPSLAPSGKKKIQWAENNMPILKELEREFVDNQYFKGVRILVCIHMEAKTARLAKLFRDSGAQVFALGCNPLSTQDDVAAALAQEENITVFAQRGISEETYFSYIHRALDLHPQIIIDDGGDVVHVLHNHRQELLKEIWGGCEETTTGVIRLKAMEADGALQFPMVSVNDAYCKYLFDNRYGTGQSVWNGINRTTNLIVSGKTVVIAGYGWCGKGCAMRAKGLGANVVICEVNPIKAMEAIMDGFRVMPMRKAAEIGDIFITLTGCKDVITKEALSVMKDGVLLANAGHFDVEISLPDLKAISISSEEVRDNITCYTTLDGRRLYLLAQGRLVNLAAGDGHPAEIMDMSFSLQLLSAKFIRDNYQALDCNVYNVPKETDRRVAQIKLNALCVSIDQLTPEQQQYLASWQISD